MLGTYHIVDPATTLEEAEAEVRAYLIVPGWSAGEYAAEVAAECLRQSHGVEAMREPWLWALYTEGARRLGFHGEVPVPIFRGTGLLASA